MPKYRVGAIKLTGEPKTRTYRLEAKDAGDAELQARKKYAATLGLSSFRNIGAFAVRID